MNRRQFARVFLSVGLVPLISMPVEAEKPQVDPALRRMTDAVLSIGKDLQAFEVGKHTEDQFIKSVIASKYELQSALFELRDALGK